MRARTLVILFFIVTFGVPVFASASTIWKSAPSHPDEIQVYATTTPRWYANDGMPSVLLDTWNQDDFTTTASTTVHIWARWNGLYLGILDVVLKASSGGDPFYGTGSTRAEVVTPLDDSYYRLNALATTSLAEYTIPVRRGEVIRNGDELWTFLYPSFAGYGANHWMGSNGLVPYIEICEGSCGSGEPTVTLLGSATTTVELGSAFIDPGTTAHDDADGDLTSVIRVTGSVDVNNIGTTTLAYAVTNSQGLSATTTRSVVVACTHDCYSSVLFLPGIEGSRLYEGTGCGKAAEEKLWEPYESLWKALRGAGDVKAKELSLDVSGTSICSDIYAKSSDVIDSVGGSAIYASLVTQMSGLKSDGTIRDWKPVAYDWRLSLPDLLSKGSEHDGKIYYEEATSTPYIEQTLRALAGSSKSGKATIVAHSNGGLLAKALLNKLGSEASKLVDKVIMVGAPQSGAPEALGVTLVGHNAGIYSYNVPIVSNAAARALAQNSPMAYHLLPSQSYFDSVMYDPAHPVARFAGNAYAKESSAYGPVIGTLTELDDFLLAKDDGRTKPKMKDLTSPEILNSTLIDYANTEHNALDGWTPPAGIEVSQIAGWGVDTVAGIDFYTSPAVSALTAAGPVRDYKPIITEDGDGTVPVPSALMMASSTSVKRYWVDLAKINNEPGVKVKRSHADLFEISSLRDFIKNLITNSINSLPTYISPDQPPTNTQSKKLTFFLHSPLTLELADSSGHVTGLAEDGSVTQDIPDSTYGEFGEVKYVSVPQGGSYTLTMHGQDAGTFSLDIEESSGGTVTDTSTLDGIPTTASTLASLTITDGIDTASPLTVDENGDGRNVFTLTPRAGEVVSYEPPAPKPVHTPATPVSNGSISIPVISPLPIILPSFSAPIEAIVATNTPLVPLVASTTTSAATTSVELSVAVLAPVSAPAVAPVGQGGAEPQGVGSVPQTASAYDAFQQSFLQRLAGAVYNGLSGIWSALMRFF